MSSEKLTAANYREWAEFAGLYVRNVSHAERYRTYAEKISRAGLVTCVAADFIDSNRSGLDLQTWRNADIYEQGEDAAYRIEQTAAALDAIGARRTAAKIRTLRNTSPLGAAMETGDYRALMEAYKNIDPAKAIAEMKANIGRAFPDSAIAAGLPAAKRIEPDPEIETLAEIHQALQRYVEAHDVELQADMAEHGDPRAEPGFDPKKRNAELEAIRRAEYDRERQFEDAAKLANLIAKLEEQLTKTPKITHGKIAASRREFLECYRKYAGRPADELVPGMREILHRAAQLQDKYPHIFRPAPTDDDALLHRLTRIGAYNVDIDGKEVSVSWSKPAGLACDWTTFSLSMRWAVKKPKSLKALLDAYDRLCKRFDQHQKALRGEVLNSYQIHSDGYERWGFDNFDLGPDGKPTEQSILDHGGPGSIHMHVGDDSDVFIDIFFHVDWDDEHGLETGIIDEPEPEPASTALPTNVTFRSSGPALTVSALAAFEKEHDVKLPESYRQFLLVQNGGEPEPNHLKLKYEGSSLPVYIVRFYSLAVDGKPADKDHQLGETLAIHRANDLPDDLVPIGQARFKDDGAAPGLVDLLICLKGKQAGKIVVPYTPMQMFPGMAGMPDMAGNPQAALMMKQMFASMCLPVAPDLMTLLSRLAPAPGQKLPGWLDAIRKNDVQAFLDWHGAKGKLTESFTPYGGMRIMTVMDYLAQEAKPDFLKALLDKAIIRPKPLCERWLQVDGKLSRFKELMPILSKADRAYAFATVDIWTDAALLNELLAAGVDLNLGIGEENVPPLHFAVQSRSPEGVRWLLEHSARPGQKDGFGRTALVWAESERQLECLKLLLEAGEKLESLFPHMPTLPDKLRLIKSRWFGDFDALAQYLRSRGIEVE